MLDVTNFYLFGGFVKQVDDPWAVNLTCEWVETFEDVLHVLTLAATSYYSYLRVNSQYH